MKISIFNTILALTILFILCDYSHAQSNKDQKSLEKALNDLKSALINADSASLMQLSSPSLSYGHSGGKIEDRPGFVSNIVTGGSDFVSIDISEQTITLVEDVAVVRHHFVAITNDKGIPGKVDLNILLIWKKKNRKWELIARQAVKHI